jgi:flagellar biosynthesis protein FlhF
VAVLTCDTFKVGACDQLKIYCQILNLPFETIRHGIELTSVLKKFEGYEAILVDYPGLALRDIQEIDQLRSLMPPMDILTQSHLVLSCAIKDEDAYEACNRYEFTRFDDLIITKIDESAIHGFLYNIQQKTERPLYAFGVGPKIPEDIELASRERVLDLIYKITKR